MSFPFQDLGLPERPTGNFSGRILTFGSIGLLLLIWMGGCSKEKLEVFYRDGDRDELKTKAIRICFGDFRVQEEATFGPFIRARIECVNRGQP